MNDTTTLRPRLLCRLNLRHHWHWESAEDGHRYVRCALCGRDHPDPGVGGGPNWPAGASF